MGKVDQLRALREAVAKVGLDHGVSVTMTAHPLPPEATETPPFDISDDSLVTVEIPKPKYKKGGLKLKTKKEKAKVKPYRLSDVKKFVPNKTKGRPRADSSHLTNEAAKPWVAQKISRRTWYRHMAKLTEEKSGAVENQK